MKIYTNLVANVDFIPLYKSKFYFRIEKCRMHDGGAIKFVFFSCVDNISPEIGFQWK